MENDYNTKALAAGVYKYVYNNAVIYIGMSKKDIFGRINAHSREEKFKPYIKDCEVFVHIMNDVENKVQLLIDEDVLKGEYLGCHPCINTSSLKLKTEDVMKKFLPAVHHEPVIVRLTGEV